MSRLFPVDDKIMMSRNLFLVMVLFLIAVCFGVLTACQSEPASPAAIKPLAPPETPAPEEPDVWTLLDRGDTEKAQAFFTGQIEVNTRDSQGRTPLHIAAERGDSKFAAFLIARGAGVNELDRQGRTPLDISALKGNVETARVLAASGGDIHHTTRDGLSPALMGVRESSGFLAALLNPRSLESVDPSGKTILHIASEQGKPGAVAVILSSGDNDLTRKDKQGKTALDIALDHGESRNHAAAAEYLIQAGAVSDNPIYAYFAPAVQTANYNSRGPDGMAPLHYMARDNHIGYLSFVLEKPADPSIKNASGATPLHEAVRLGNIKVIEALLDHGAEVNAQDAKGNTALHIAAPPLAEDEIAALLFSRGADPNFRDGHGDTPLHIAVILNRPPELAGLLLENGADPGIRNIDGKTPLHLAVEDGRAPCIPVLLSFKADVFAADNNGRTPFELAITENPGALPLLVNPETTHQSDGQGNTMLHSAVSSGADTEVLRLLLDNDIPVNARNREGDTGLHLAVRMNNEKAGSLLLARGADIFAPNAHGESPLYLTIPQAGTEASDLRVWMFTPQTFAARDGLGNTVLHYAALWCLDPWIQPLVLAGAFTETANAIGETPLFTAVKNNSPGTILELIHAEAHLDARDRLGNTALHAAVRWNAVKAAETLIGLGLDVNSRTLNGKTPLHDSVRLGMTEIEVLLLSSGADPNVRDALGNTPFMEAVLAARPSSMERLVYKGADTNTRNFRGDTPLHLAAASGKNEIVSLLFSWGASIHARNSMGRTPFQTALAVSPDIVKSLLSGFQLYSADDFGSTPLHIAIQERASLETVNTILLMGGKTTALDSEGRTPMRAAVDTAQWETAKLLADSGADIFLAARDGKSPAGIILTQGTDAITAVFSGGATGVRDAAGNTILHYAARTGDTAVIRQLLELGADRSIKNIANERAADIALRWEHSQATALLE